MKKIAIAVLAVAAAVALGPVAKADTFDFTLTSDDGGANATGTLTGAYDSGTGAYDITSGSFTITANASSNPSGEVGTFTNLAVSSYTGADNEVTYPAAFGTPYVDESGISFDFGDGTSINIYAPAGLTFTGAGTNDYGIQEGDTSSPSGGFYNANSELTITTTPEPSSMFLLSTGILGLAIVLFRKSNSPISSIGA